MTPLRQPPTEQRQPQLQEKRTASSEIASGPKWEQHGRPPVPSSPPPVP